MYAQLSNQYEITCKKDGNNSKTDYSMKTKVKKNLKTGEEMI
jgi:hypothetical protein